VVINSAQYAVAAISAPLAGLNVAPSK
jgi:hypothetical protein